MKRRDYSRHVWLKRSCETRKYDYSLKGEKAHYLSPMDISFESVQHIAIEKTLFPAEAAGSWKVVTG
jgi:hypothetical protein